MNDITPAAAASAQIVEVSPVEIASGVEGLVVGGDGDGEELGTVEVEVEEPREIGVEVEVEKKKEEEPTGDIPTIIKPKRARRQRNRHKIRGKDTDVEPAKETTTKEKGWRQTPLLEPNPSFQPFATLKGKKRRPLRGDENGWATEDATDVQDMGDFDFAGSLAKFDKREVFTQIQAEDSVADEDRLVAHNRLPRAKPGTAGGKNLHYTENVLDVPGGTVRGKGETWKSEAGDSEGEVEERASQWGSGSGRLSRRADRERERAESKFSVSRRPISRKGSSNINVPPARTLSVSHTTPFPHYPLIKTGPSLSQTIILPRPVRSSLRAHLSPPNAQS